ncbi:MAG: class I SAM-dependent methyltransferase [Verrucomicrobiota bacterium]
MDRQYYKEYYALERSHWWFLGRLIIIKNLINKQILKTRPRNLKILNIGVATGATSIMLKSFGDVTSVEYDNDCCEFLMENAGIDAICASMTNLPFDNNSFDLVCAFDVVEHIEDDSKAILELKRVLKHQGSYFLTVPAFTFLWSHHDVVNHHFRRYSQSDLIQKLNQVKLEVSYKTFFCFFTFLPVATLRLLQRIFPRKTRTMGSGSDFEVMNSSKCANTFLLNIMKLENFLLTLGIKFPFGVSFLVIGISKNSSL